MTDIYEAVLQAIEKLSPSDQLRMVSDLTDRIPHRSREKSRQHSILELRGLGREMWVSVDPDEYVERERSSWNG